jgi:Flagellar protein FliT
MVSKVDELQQLVAFSQAMLTKAQAEQWDDVVALEAERRDLIKHFFSEQVDQAQAEVVASGIKAILAIDEKLMELGALRRFDIMHVLQDMDQGKKAVKAYTS